jgi:1-deoxy-D-xylulose-5-phosphate synthase
VSDWLDDEIAKSEIVAIEPATPCVLQYLRYKYPTRFIDTGITESFAVTYAAGLAKGDVKPFIILDPGFSQRAYDQIVQNAAMQNLNVSIVIVGGAIECVDQSHVAMYDITMLGNIPNLVYLAPTSYFECKQMLDFMKLTKCPTALRLGGKFFNQIDRETPEIVIGQSEVVRQGKGIAIIGVGKFLQKAISVADFLALRGIVATIINPRFISTVDRDLLDELVKTHSKFVTIEDGVIEGGYGQKITSYLAKHNVTVYNYGAGKEFTHYIPYKELMERYHLNPEQIADEVLI